MYYMPVYCECMQYFKTTPMQLDCMSNPWNVFCKLEIEKPENDPPSMKVIYCGYSPFQDLIWKNSYSAGHGGGVEDLLKKLSDVIFLLSKDTYFCQTLMLENTQSQITHTCTSYMWYFGNDQEGDLAN